MIPFRQLAALAAAAALATAAAGRPIPEAEALQPPTPARLAAVAAAAKQEGWGPQQADLRAAARLAYERDKLPAAEAWNHVRRWAELFAQTEAEFVPQWIAAVNAAQVGHPNMPSRYGTRPVPIGDVLAPELKLWLLGQTELSGEFHALVSPVDFLPRSFAILQELYAHDAAVFKKFPALAVAIALVYDVPPPPIWPHAQVTAEALPRRFPAPTAAFAWWAKQEQLGKTYHRLARLGPDELKFLVDVAAPFAELEWAQLVSNHPLGQLAGAYTMVRYRNDRLANRTPIWSGSSYALAEIMAAGGICADQAYFATQVGKARGVPTLLFSGAGNDGRHAWFGYLGADGKWKMDAGRYAEQRFVTGFARDPQTWREISDHELAFLGERFRDLPSFRQSRVHVAFAADFLATGLDRAAGTAARKAVNFERRNQAGWEFLLTAARREGRDAKAVEGLLREAAAAFARYPDLELLYGKRLADSLRARGETSLADAELQRLAAKNRSGRSDLNVEQARDAVRRAIATQPLPQQLLAYNQAVDTFGRGAGVAFFDQVVAGFVEHLVRLGRRAEAQQALDRARRALRVEPKSQLAADFDLLGKTVRETK